MQQKILNLVPIFMLALMAVYAGVWFYQQATLGTVVGDAPQFDDLTMLGVKLL